MVLFVFVFLENGLLDFEEFREMMLENMKSEDVRQDELRDAFAVRMFFFLYLTALALYAHVHVAKGALCWTVVARASVIADKSLLASACC